MKIIYECGDVFKAFNNEHCIIGGTDNGFKLISLKNGFGYDFECNTEKEITEYINNEGFEYIGRAEDVISIICKDTIVENDCKSNYNPTFKHSYVGGIKNIINTNRNVLSEDDIVTIKNIINDKEKDRWHIKVHNVIFYVYNDEGYINITYPTTKESIGYYKHNIAEETVIKGFNKFVSKYIKSEN